MSQALKTQYQLPVPELWQGRQDSEPNERYFQRVQCCDLYQDELPENSFALLGFASDEGIQRNLGRVGAASGPTALKKQLANLCCHDNLRHNVLDVGEITCLDHQLEVAQQQFSDCIATLLRKNIKPVAIGGGHEIAWAHYQGIRQVFTGRLGIINFDAHFDMRKSEHATSGTPFLQIAEQEEDFQYLVLGLQASQNTNSLFATAKQYGVNYLYAEQIHQRTLISTIYEIDHFLMHLDGVYVTCCLDVFDSSVAPGVSAPQINGLLPAQILTLIKHLAKTDKVVSFDIAELSPDLDRDNMTAKLAASIANEYMHATR